MRCSSCGRIGAHGCFPVIAAAEIFLQPNVEADEQVAAAHLPDLQLGLARAAVAPGDGDDGPGEPAHDRFERQFDREIEMRRDQGPAALDDLAPVGLEGVGGVVEADGKKRLQEEIRHPVDEQLDASGNQSPRRLS